MVIPVQAKVENLLVRTPWLDRQIDRLGEALQGWVRGLFLQTGPRGLEIRNVLNGVWLGHPLHAAISDSPIGAWTSGMIFDYLGALTGRGSVKSAGDLATGAGVVGGIAAALAGLADYSEIEDEQRRFGTVHAILNAAALVCYLLSLRHRLGGDRANAIPLSTLGYLLTFISSDLGGNMVYRYGTLVNRQAWTGGPSSFVPVLAVDQLADGQLRAVSAEGVEVLLTRVNGRVSAIGNTCTHWGCSLAEGSLVDTSVRCRCHGSQFSLADGSVINGPASSPEPSYDVRLRNGQIEVRRRPY